MSSSPTSSLSAGVQQLYNDGLLPSNLSTSTLKNASAGQLNKIAASSIASQEVNVLLGGGSSVSDTASLSSTATNALLQEINPSSTTGSSTTDALTAAVNNALTSSLNAAVKKFAAPTSNTTTGSQINLLA
jgi:hypothetical protein